MNVDACISGRNRVSFGVVITGNNGQLLCAGSKEIQTAEAVEIWGDVFLECNALTDGRALYNRQE